MICIYIIWDQFHKRYLSHQSLKVVKANHFLTQGQNQNHLHVLIMPQICQSNNQTDGFQNFAKYKNLHLITTETDESRFDINDI